MANTGPSGPTIEDPNQFINTYAYSDDGLTLTLIANGQSGRSQNFYISGLEMIAPSAEIAKTNLELNINDFDGIDHTSNTNIRIGQPSIEFNTGRQLCVLSDYTIALDSIIYREGQVAGTAVLWDEIKIIIPNDEPFIWASAGSNDENGLVNGGNVYSNSYTDKILKVNVVNSFGPGDVLKIYNAQIQMTGEMNSGLLSLQVNSDHGDDDVMHQTHYIRIGQPTITSDTTQYLVHSDPDTSDSYIMETMTITDGSAPIINPDDPIKITLPDGIAWNPFHLPSVAKFYRPCRSIS
jgi:hypothetical protein